MQRRQVLLGMAGVTLTACGGGGGGGAVANGGGGGGTVTPPKPTTWVVSTWAGQTDASGMGLSGYADDVGTSALFNFPIGIVADTQGHLYVADSQNGLIRRVHTQTAAVLTWAGQKPRLNTANSDGTRLSATFSEPYGLSIDASGNLYVSDQTSDRIRCINAAGVVSTLPDGSASPTPDNPDPGGGLTLYNPSGVAVDASGQVYVADSQNHLIRQISPDGAVTILAGRLDNAGAGLSGSADGAGSVAQFNNPLGLALDPAGRRLLVADTDNHLIRQIDLSSGSVSTLAGAAHPAAGENAFGQADGSGTAARFYSPSGLAIDASGTVYVADTSNHLIRQITPAGVVSTLAGTSANDGGYQDGTGTAAEFNQPVGIALDPGGNLWVADSQNHLIRRISPKP